MRSNVHCTNCGGDFGCELDLTLNGNHTITCPLCGHDHYRVVRDGEVTEDRWASSQPTYTATTTTTTFSSTIYLNAFASGTGTTTSTQFTYQLWIDRSDMNMVTS